MFYSLNIFSFFFSKYDAKYFLMTEIPKFSRISMEKYFVFHLHGNEFFPYFFWLNYELKIFNFAKFTFHNYFISLHF